MFKLLYIHNYVGYVIFWLVMQVLSFFACWFLGPILFWCCIWVEFIMRKENSFGFGHQWNVVVETEIKRIFWLFMDKLICVDFYIVDIGFDEPIGYIGWEIGRPCLTPCSIFHLFCATINICSYSSLFVWIKDKTARFSNRYPYSGDS